MEFNELKFFAKLKKRPELYLGERSLKNFRDFIFGMNYAFRACGREDALKYFNAFVEWYHGEVLTDQNGYACWWNHLLYVNGGSDAGAFDSLFKVFEGFLKKKYELTLPQVANNEEW